MLSHPQTQASSSRATQERCLLFTLPAEPRNRIYELVLAVSPVTINFAINSDLTVLCLRKHYRAHGSPDQSVLDLLATCHSIYNEAMPIFYSQQLLLLRTRALPDLQNRLRKVPELAVLVHYPEEIILACKQLASLPHLKKLYFVMARPTILSKNDDWVFEAERDLWNPRDEHDTFHASYKFHHPSTFKRYRSAIVEMENVKEWELVYRKPEDMNDQVTRRLNSPSNEDVSQIERDFNMFLGDEEDDSD